MIPSGHGAYLPAPRFVVLTTMIALLAHGLAAVLLIPLATLEWGTIAGVGIVVAGLVSIPWHRWAESLAGVVLGLATIALMVGSGGADSFFLLWLFVLAAVFPMLLPPPWSWVFASSIPIAYLVLAWFGPPHTLPAVVIVSRVAILALIGALGTRYGSGLEQLRALDERFRELVEGTPDAVVGVDPAGMVTLANAAATTMFGYEVDDLVSKPLSLLVPENYRNVHGGHVIDFLSRADLAREMATDRPNLVARRADGTTFPVAITISRLARPGRAEAIAIVRDLTSHLDLVESIRDREEEITRMARARSELVGTVAHELRTPLTSVLGFSSILSEPGIEEEERTRLLAEVVEHATDLGHIVENLLTAARVEHDDLTISQHHVDLAEEAQRVILSVTMPTEREIKPPVGPVPCVADPPRLRQLIRNLLTNALRHGGATIEVRARAEEGQAILEVIDDGPGIPEEDQERVFSRFEHGDVQEGVTRPFGLGLSVSRELASLMHGTLTYSRENGRSQFSLRLPSPG